jgi:hypothetical protein
MTRLTRIMAATVGTLLLVHITLTFFENTPDTKVSLGTRIPWLNRFPQWRFFAPNPGTDNTHVFFRWSSEDDWSKWKEIPYRNPLKWYSFIWNPGSRAPKALFDTSQQIMVLAGYGASYEWAVESAAYRLLSDTVRDICQKDGRVGAFQFMIMTSTPGAGPTGMRPILVSEEIPIAPIPTEVGV